MAESEIGSFGESPFYPVVGFYFQVSFDGISASVDSKFSEVTGMSMETEGGEQVKEGGENTFSHRLPGRTKYSDLVLKRGLLSADSDLATWCIESIQNNFSTTLTLRDVYVKLMNEQGDAVMTWQFFNAYPIKMEVNGLNSTSTGNGAIVVESITLAYTYFQVVTV